MLRKTKREPGLTTYAVVGAKVAVTLMIMFLDKAKAIVFGREFDAILDFHNFAGNDHACEWSPNGNCSCDGGSMMAEKLVAANGHGTEAMWKELEGLLFANEHESAVYKAAGLKERPMRILGYILKISNHLGAARAGDRERESRLVTRLGELRADFPSREAFKAWAEEDPQLLGLLKEAFGFLQSVGRIIDLRNADPARWISARGGSPRMF